MTSAVPELPLQGDSTPVLDPRLQILFESPDLLVLNKPADLVCHPTKTDAWSSLAGRIRLHLGPEAKIHLVHRLDRETSGIVVAAKTPTAARDLGRLWEQGVVTKQYLAIVYGQVQNREGIIDGPLGPDPLSIVAIKDCVRPDGSPARTRWQRLSSWTTEGRDYSLLQVTPESGRKHQIRIHLAHVGHPIVGDKLYGNDENFYLDLVAGRLSEEQRARLQLPCHALHAGHLSFEWNARLHSFEVRPEPWFLNFLPATTIPADLTKNPFEIRPSDLQHPPL